MNMHGTHGQGKLFKILTAGKAQGTLYSII